MVTVIFKILLIILIPAPVIALAAYFYVQMLGFISERNKAEKKHLKDGSLKVSKSGADKDGMPGKEGSRTDKKRKADKSDKKRQERKAKGRSSRTE